MASKRNRKAKTVSHVSNVGPPVDEWARSDCWRTPRDIANALGAFDLDPCGGPGSHIHAFQHYWWERREDGLRLPWAGSVFINPPYSNVLPWARRAAAHDEPVTLLLKFDSTTEWFAVLVRAGARFYPFRRRVAFERPDKVLETANFPSLLVTLRQTVMEDMEDFVWKLSC